MTEDRNFILAIVLCTLVIILWQVLFAPEPPQPVDTADGETSSAQNTSDTAAGGAPIPSAGERDLTPQVGDTASASAPAVSPASDLSREQALEATLRVAIEAPRIRGSISLQGALIDDIQLKDYHQELSKDSEQVKLLHPRGVRNAYYGAFGWLNAGGTPASLPTLKTQWTQEGSNPLSPETPVTLVWDNGEGLKFTRRIEVDEDFMLTISDQVENYGSSSVLLSPYGQIARYSKPETLNFFILHEGFIGVTDGTLNDVDYKKVVEDGPVKYSSTGGWIGITDKNWLAAIIPDQNETFSGAYKYYEPTATSPEIYTTEYVLTAREVAPGASETAQRRFFAGAKEVEVLSKYQKQGATRFDLAVDWGMFFFLTRPFFWILHTLASFFGNFGIGILLLTVVVKLAFFPLANQSYVAMSKMRKVQPEMMKIRERYKDDRTKQNQELMELYKREKVNPMAGCLPMLVQIPVFFSLYKVLFVTIEMRHQPFFGWIQDLSAPDPTNVFNLFGLLPYSLPDWMPVIGIWPLIMGFTMYFQTKLNPAPQDPVQEKIFAFMPIMFTFILARFPAGLVIYWAWNNTLSIIQQYTIMRRMGVEVNLADRFKMPGFLKNLQSQFGGKASAGTATQPSTSGMLKPATTNAEAQAGDSSNSDGPAPKTDAALTDNTQDDDASESSAEAAGHQSSDPVKSAKGNSDKKPSA